MFFCSFCILFRYASESRFQALTKTPPMASGPFRCLSPEGLTRSPIPGPGRLRHKRALQVDLSGVFRARHAGGCLGQQNGSDVSDQQNNPLKKGTSSEKGSKGAYVHLYQLPSDAFEIIITITVLIMKDIFVKSNAS